MSNSRKATYILFCASILSGCHSNNFFTAKYQEDNYFKKQSISEESSVVVATAKDGMYMNEKYPGSGKFVTESTQQAFSSLSRDISVSKCNDINCIKTENVRSYCVVPEIIHWEERATEWSAIPDQIKLRITVYDGVSYEPIAGTSITGLSKWFTFGGDHPQDLVEKPVEKFVRSLYAKEK